MRARSLLSAPGQSYVCDAKCETQARSRRRGTCRGAVHLSSACCSRDSNFQSSCVAKEQGLGVPEACSRSGAAWRRAACAPQVRLLEALILSITLISALLSGTCMLHALCTPTRFEAPKGERAHGDS